MRHPARKKSSSKRETTAAKSLRSVSRARLSYASDRDPGFSRKRQGDGFSYHRADGKRLRDRKALERIRALAIPPAWTDVWINPKPRGHIQATGRDARGRKQYRYHPHWRQVRDESKYSRMALFGSVLPQIRIRVQRDLASPGLSQKKVLAAVVRLMETTHLRVGNEEYARSNGSYGLSTLHDQHVQISGATIRFCFRGKSGKMREAEFNDPRLARIVKRCRDLPGQKLFQYLDQYGKRKTIDSGDLNEYLREISGHDFTAKDFRTWAGTMWAARSLKTIDPPQTQRELKSRTLEVVRIVAEHLGNTVAVCRKAYIHPFVLEAVGDPERLKRFGGRSISSSSTGGPSWEKFLVRYLKQCEKRAG